MTREQKIDMFAMRIYGASLLEIGKKYGINKERVRQILTNEVKKPDKQRKNYVYPNILYWIEENDIKQTDIARDLHCTQAYISSVLTGKSKPSLDLALYLSEKMGMDIREIFSKDE